MIDINDLTIGQARKLAEILPCPKTVGVCPLLGKYVIVRCKDAGVHAGVLESRQGRECVLINSRRLWYWKPAEGKWLSSVAIHGLDESSKVGEPIGTIILTENCEIIGTTEKSEASIRAIASNG